MRINSARLKSIAILLFFGTVSLCHAQSWRSDSLTVVTLIDSNRIKTKTFADIAMVEGGRITGLDLSKCNLQSLSGSIGNMDALTTLILS
jgi:hypothetical protein